MASTMKFGFFLSSATFIFSLNASANSSCLNLFAEVSKPTLSSRTLNLDWVNANVFNAPKKDKSVEKLSDVVRRSGLNEAAMDVEVLLRHTEDYTNELITGPITNQMASGRCWIFSGTNMLTAQLVREGKVDRNFKFSNNYLNFFSYLERVNFYLNRVIDAGDSEHSRRTLQNILDPKNSLFDGGWFSDFQFLVKKYGLVPEAAMPETASTGNTEPVLEVLHIKLAQIASRIAEVTSQNDLPGDAKGTPYTKEQLKRIQEIREEGMEDVVAILTTHFGRPPSHFNYRTLTNAALDPNSRTVLRDFKVETLTPVEFAKNVVEFNPNDYVVISANEHLPTGAKYLVKGSSSKAVDPGERSGNVITLNVTMERMLQMTTQSIDNGNAVWFASDVGKDAHLSPRRGIEDQASGILHPDLYDRDAVYGFEKESSSLKLPRRVMTYYRMTAPTHAMVIVAHDSPDPTAPPVKLKVENSWGEGAGDYGYLHMYREWFEANVFQIVVHKSSLSKEELATWKGPSTPLKEDDFF